MGEQVQQVDGGMAGIGQSRKGHVAKVCSVGRGGAMLAAGYLFYTRYVVDNQVKLLQLVRCTHGGCLAIVAAILGKQITCILIMNILRKCMQGLNT